MLGSGIEGEGVGLVEVVGLGCVLPKISGKLDLKVFSLNHVFSVAFQVSKIESRSVGLRRKSCPKILHSPADGGFC